MMHRDVCAGRPIHDLIPVAASRGFDPPFRGNVSERKGVILYFLSPGPILVFVRETVVPSQCRWIRDSNFVVDLYIYKLPYIHGLAHSPRIGTRRHICRVFFWSRPQVRTLGYVGIQNDTDRNDAVRDYSCAPASRRTQLTRHADGRARTRGAV